MTAETFGCPSCGARLRRAFEVTAGELVRCPRCAVDFGAPPSPVLSREEAGDGRFRADLPARPAAPPVEDDEDDEVRDRPRRGDDGDGPLTPADLDPKGYADSLAYWQNVAGKHWADFLGPFIGAAVLFGVIGLVVVIPVGEGFSVLRDVLREEFDPKWVSAVLFLVMAVTVVVLLSPLYAGLFAVPLKMLRGRSWTFGDFFAGFSRLPSVLGFSLILSVVSAVLFVPVILYDILLDPAETPLWLGVWIADAVAQAVVLTLLGGFGTPLILDRKFTALQAISGSIRLARGHLVGLSGAALVLSIFGLVGLMTCFGVLFTMPFVILAWTAGYLRAIGATIYDPQGRVIPESGGLYRYQGDEEFVQGNDLRGKTLGAGAKHS